MSSSYMTKSLVLSRSRRQRRLSVHVARTFAWRPWTSSTTLASAWGSFCPTTAEVICYLRCTFIVIRFSTHPAIMKRFQILSFSQVLPSPSTASISSQLFLHPSDWFSSQLRPHLSQHLHSFCAPGTQIHPFNSCPWYFGDCCEERIGQRAGERREENKDKSVIYSVSKTFVLLMMFLYFSLQLPHWNQIYVVEFTN